MTRSDSLRPGAPFPHFAWPQVGGGTLNPAAGSGWRILMVYRGKHCPLCKRYFKELGAMLASFSEAGIAISAVSADPADRAQADVDSEGWQFPVGHSMPLDDMRKLGLFISAPRSEQETDRPFAEPGMFIINPDGNTQTIQVGNASYTRADLEILKMGLGVTIQNNYPVRGTMD